MNSNNKIYIRFVKFLNTNIVFIIIIIVLISSLIIPMIINETRLDLCLFQLLFKIRCPLCGMTRSFIHITRLQFVKAFYYNRSGIFIYLNSIIYIVLFIFKTKICKNLYNKINKVTLIITVLAVLINWFIAVCT